MAKHLNMWEGDFGGIKEGSIERVKALRNNLAVIEKIGG